MDSDSPHSHHHHQQHHPQQHHHQHHHHQQQHHQHQHHHQQPPPPIMVSTNNNSSYTIPTTNTNTNSAPSSMSMMMSQQQHQIQGSSQNPNSSMDRFPFNSMVNSGSGGGGGQPTMEYSDGSPRGGGSGFNIEPARKKRGRPRKYSPDGNIGLALSPTPVTPGSGGGAQVDYSGGGGSGGGTTPSSEPSGKRRGRPPGSGKKQLDALGGTTGVGFTPHVITVKAGKDIASKLMEFAQQGPRTVCILSANGAIANVTLRQPAMAGGTVSYEGRFEIISLSGTFSRQRPADLSVSLAGSDGRVLGGGVAGPLMAASPIQVIVGSFIADGKKQKAGPPSGPPLNMLNFGAPATGTSPPSQDASSDSSDENDDNPFNRAQGGPYSNVSQPLQSAPMYSNMGWPNPGIKMHPN